MLFLAFEDPREQIAADEIMDLFAVRDGALQLRHRLHFKRQIALQHFFDRLPDAQAAEQLEIG